MHVKSLKVFCDVVVRRSFSRAADENGISQSGASQIVQQLEDSLGVKLIDRSKRPFVLTPEGKVYYEGCRRLVQSFFALEEKVRTLRQQVEGRVNVASIYSVGLSYGKELVREFTERYPKATVNLEYHHPQRVYELVTEGQADIGLVSCVQQTRALTAVPWLEEPMILVCSPAHPLAERQSLRLADLDGLEIIGFDLDLSIRRSIDRELAAREVHLQVVMAFDNIDTIKRAIEVNAGVSLLPEPTVRRELELGSLVSVPLAGLDLVRPLAIIYRRGFELGVTARRFIQLLQEDTAGLPEIADGPRAEPDLDAACDEEANSAELSREADLAANATSHAPDR
jgi:DNA-binding transcriptional LysR family regulator